MSAALDPLRRVLGALPAALPAARAHLPGAPVDARRRELVAEVVAGAAGRDDLADLHRRWLAVLGPAELTEVDDDVLTWAASSARAAVAGRAVSGGALPEELDARTRRCLVALVRHGVAVAVTAEAATSLARRAGGRARPEVAASLGELAAVAAGGPIALPTVVIGGLVGAIGRLAPDAPAVEIGPDPNLLTQLLAETLPTWLGSAWGRTLVRRLPVAVPIAVRSGLTGATVRVGRGRVVVENGIGEDIWALFDGEVDALLRAGSRSLARELRTARPRR